MSRKKIEQQVRRHAGELIQEKGYASPVDLLVKMERLNLKQVKDWRLKKIPYLEKVMNGNLGKLNHTLHTLKKFAKEHDLKPSVTVYHSWGKGPTQNLRFSKSGDRYMEELYSNHYIHKTRKKE
ncbi:hypothetical protein GWK91_01365 [Virgibacillus sp. MSP4-1]|uniref:hypothetical protein n=1 Tax=Virgibacillus sp. MSP4-1 TaxID=2700081 RepID=UPI0003A3F2D9|nr:hypothetical protein [Virgibacillus sp. MSP4-1]QHS21682.1 hypothetical protein GWK91_01365 [Virgibacillus sp. MSP4-1]